MQWKRSLAQPGLSFSLSFLFHEQPRAAQAGDDDAQRCSVTLTVAITLMENAFEIEEGGVNDGRIWRETQREMEEEGDDRRKNKGGAADHNKSGVFPSTAAVRAPLDRPLPTVANWNQCNTTRSP